MPTLTIRQVDDALKSALRLRAARNGHSMEEEVRQVLRASFAHPDSGQQGLGSRLHARFASLGGVNLRLPRRSPPRDPPDLSKQ